jgi:hypothetical protein
MNGIPNRASDAGPDIQSNHVACQNCGNYAAPGDCDETQPDGPECSEKDCDIRLCAECQENEYRCYDCGRWVCSDHSRPNYEAKGRICPSCDAERKNYEELA